VPQPLAIQLLIRNYSIDRANLWENERAFLRYKRALERAKPKARATTSFLSRSCTSPYRDQGRVQTNRHDIHIEASIRSK